MPIKQRYTVNYGMARIHSHLNKHEPICSYVKMVTDGRKRVIELAWGQCSCGLVISINPGYTAVPYKMPVYRRLVTRYNDSVPYNVGLYYAENYDDLNKLIGEQGDP